MSIWLVDADAVKIGENTLNIIYKNNRIKEYLYDENSSKLLGLTGTKGQGKTFLIKVKRNLLQHSKKNNTIDSFNSITCFPKDASMVDTLDGTLTPHRSISKFITSYDEWVKIWKYSIAITILTASDCKHYFNNKDFLKLSRITKSIMTFPNEKCKPSVVLSSLLSLTIDEFKIATSDNLKLMQLLVKINSAIYVFIDKVEQGFAEELNASSTNKKQLNECIKNWHYSQYALAQTAYDIFSNCNQHIKIYYTIRHEVLLEAHNMAPNLSSNIDSYILELSYSKDEMYEMFCLYIENEKDENLALPDQKNTNAQSAFLGFDNIPEHSYVKDYSESTFDYLYRHSLRRPRDLMSLCNELYLNDPKKMNRTIFRRTINDISGDVLKKYLAEVEPFTVLSRQNIDNLLRSINTNIFDFSYLQFVCERFNCEYGPLLSCKRDCSHCRNSHPFTTLYNIGLLGYLHSSEATKIPEQRFLPIGDSKLKLKEHSLKNSELYLLHPCLCDISRDFHKEQNRNFKTADETVVGEGIVVETEKIEKIKSNLKSFKEELNKEKIFISSTIRDLVKERKSIRGGLFNKGLYPILSEADNFKEGSNDIDSHDHCIRELLQCNQMIYMIGKKIGGHYGGTEYKKFAKLIEGESHDKIVQPSISLMEFYVAQRMGLKYHVLIDCAVLDAVYKHNAKEDITDLGVDKEVISIVNFVNHLSKDGVRKGNWMISFKNINELKRKLKSLSFAVN